HALHHHGIIRSTARRLLALEADPAAWRAMSAAARDIRTPPMTDAFLEACHRAAPTATPTGPTGTSQGVRA
ncbi:MAG: hypothetical protein Q4G40_08545, partial [Brachybacterium sp.]|nr:hypothetical protein [Brachybacterium sp.]